jgi:trimethylamine-N-oxide reductase (cytochrome c)
MISANTAIRQRGYQSTRRRAARGSRVFQDKAIEPLWECARLQEFCRSRNVRLGRQFTRAAPSSTVQEFWEKSDLWDKISWEDSRRRFYSRSSEGQERHYGFRWFAEGYPGHVPTQVFQVEQARHFTGKFEFVSVSLLTGPRTTGEDADCHYKHSWEGQHSIRLEVSLPPHYRPALRLPHAHN